MNTIRGKVVVKESGDGVPDLVVVAYDVDPASDPDEDAAALASSSGLVGDRIGSVLTDEDGAFELDYGDDAFRVGDADERRPDILLTVLAPEDAAVDPGMGVLFTSR